MDCAALIGLVAAIAGAPPADNDHIWAARARAEAMQAVAANSRMYFGGRLAGGDTAPREAQPWPYEGLAPSPRTFDLSALPAPIGTIEWRRTKGELVESHAVGSEAVLAAIRAAKPAPSAGAEATPGPDWSRDEVIPDALACDEKSAIWVNATMRSAWCSAWADCYEVDAGRVHLVVVRVDGVADADLVAVVAAEGGPRATRVGAIPAENIESVGAGACAVIAVADFDANGTRDCFVSAVYTSCGLGLTTFEGFFVLAEAKAGRVRATPYAARALDFIDLDGNGRAEVLSMTFEGCDRCTDGKPHNFFITNLLGFQDLGVVDLRGVHRIRHGEFTGTFPAFEWYANEEDQRFRPLLTLEDKRRLGAVPYPRYARREASAPTE